MELIQRAQAAHMQQDPSNLRVMHCRALAGSLDKQFAGCSEKSPNTNNNKHKSLAVATPSFTSFFRSALRNLVSSIADDLLRMGTTAGQNMIPKKMLTKVCKENMTTMAQINTLIAHAGSKELSTWRLKNLEALPNTLPWNFTVVRLRNKMPGSKNPLTISIPRYQ